MTYRVLIVDDESFVTDWVSYQISEVFKDELEVYKTNEAKDALDKLVTGVYDIAVLDINMPGISGIEMLREIEKQKLDTQIIFLTAHNEFSYAQKAISPQVISYILKGDSDEQLIESIKTAMQRIRQKAETNNLLKIAKSRLQVAAPTVRREYIIKLLQGLTGANELEQASIPLYIDTKKPVLLMICSINSTTVEKDNIDLLLEISNYIEGVLNRYFTFEGAMPEKNSFVWLLQPLRDRYDQVIPMLLSVIENSQIYFNRHTGMNLMFVYYSKTFPFHEIGKIYRMLSYIQGYGYGKEHIVLTEESVWDNNEEAVVGRGEEYEELSRQAAILTNLLEHGEKEECMGVLKRLLKVFDGSIRKNDPLANEAFMYLSAAAFSYINKTSITTAYNDDYHAAWLGNPGAFASWNEVPKAFEKLFNQFFALQVKKKDNRSQNCITKAKEYIVNNLDKDLSLIMLAEKVYLNPSYFSILFKNKVGCNVSEYIKAERLKKAKQQLVDTKFKINEIAKNVGYPNAAYFGKFIKSETGMTPLEYRNKYMQ